MSTFEHGVSYDGTEIEARFSYRTVGLPIDGVVGHLGIPQPDLIKIDVDGIEHLVLGGGVSVLNSVSSVLVEVNEDFHEQAVNCSSILSTAGLSLKEKRHSALMATGRFSNVYNQIWVRS